MSYVCPIHEQYVPDDKRCPYCVEPESLPDGNYAGVLMTTSAHSDRIYEAVTIPAGIWDTAVRRRWGYCACGAIRRAGDCCPRCGKS